jgi:isoleucyl-tRNA synthetase
MTQDEIATLEKTNRFAFAAEGENVEISLEEVVISSEDLEGWLVMNDGNLTVALDVSISEDLKAEGIARELVNRIQNIRKEQNFEVTDRISLKVQNSDYIKEAIDKFGAYICNEVLATELKLENSLSNAQEVELEENQFVKLLVEKN